jgi:uncharacterized membrane protein (UPF0127 family)
MSAFREKLGRASTSLTLFALCIQLTCMGELHAAKPEHLLKKFPRSKLIINTSDSKCILFDVYVAQTPEHRSQGLMHIESMGSYEGMIFIYSASLRISMWMKNTLLPLDMLFIDKDLKIASIHADAVPHSEEIIKSGKEVAAVIELNAGSINRFNIKTGNRIIFPAN